MKVWYGPYGLGLGQGHGETVYMCTTVLYMYLKVTIYINTLYTHNTESCISTLTSEA